MLISNTGEMSFSHKFLENDNMFPDKKVIARARYTKSLAEIGWSRLFIETFDNSQPEVQSWAAGYLEGKLCAREIIEFYKNLVGIHEQEATYLQDVFNFYSKVENGIRARTSKASLGNVPADQLEYWISVAMNQAQIDGLFAGYN